MSSGHWVDSRKFSRGEHAIQEAPMQHTCGPQQAERRWWGKNRVKEKWDLSSNAVEHKFKLWVPVQKQYVKPHSSVLLVLEERLSADILPYPLLAHACTRGPVGVRLLSQQSRDWKHPSQASKFEVNGSFTLLKGYKISKSYARGQEVNLSSLLAVWPWASMLISGQQ